MDYKYTPRRQEPTTEINFLARLSYHVVGVSLELPVIEKNRYILTGWISLVAYGYFL